jgi:flagellar hook-associated protein 2
LKINKTAKAAYLTGARIDNSVTTFEGKQVKYSENHDLDKDTTLISAIDSNLVGKTINVESIAADGVSTVISTFTISDTTTMSNLVSGITNEANGVSASFDDTFKKLTISSTGKLSDSANSIKITIGGYNTDSEATAALEELGLNVSGVKSKQTYTSDTKLSSIDNSLTNQKITITTGIDENKKSTEIEITSDMTISDFVSKLKSAGVNASFDENNQRFFISASATGEANKFEISATNSDVLDKLGIGTKATMIDASDAIIKLNNAEFTSNTNTFSINGLTINVTDTTADGETLTISTDTDYDGIYDMIKDFVSEYNEIINDIYQKYNADSARKYSMLTDDEKEAMTDDEIEEWEDKIKSALLRKDTTLQSLMSSLVNVINDSYGTDSNGNKLYLFSYGIETLGYFEADEDERYALHIAGDPDDENTSSDDDLLKAALASDPDTTVNFFTNLCKTLYSTLYDAMKSTDYSSIYKVYEDKRLQDEYDDYDDKISDAEDELSDYEDYWYDKFSAMETALSKLQSTQSVVTSMLGS